MQQISNSIFTRKVQILKHKEKISEIKGVINEIEIFPDNVVEWWFIPVKTGIFDDLNCKITDEKSDKTHSQMGMRGRIIIE